MWAPVVRTSFCKFKPPAAPKVTCWFPWAAGSPVRVAVCTTGGVALITKSGGDLKAEIK